MRLAAADGAGLALRDDVLQPFVEEFAHGIGPGDGCIAGLDLGDELGQLSRRLTLAALEGARHLAGCPVTGSLPMKHRSRQAPGVRSAIAGNPCGVGAPA